MKGDAPSRGGGKVEVAGRGEGGGDQWLSVGHATGEWEEGGEGVQGGGRGKRKIQELAVAVRWGGGGGLKEGTTMARQRHYTLHTVYLVYRRKCTYVGCVGGDQHPYENGLGIYSTVPYLSKELKIRQNMKKPKSAKIL